MYSSQLLDALSQVDNTEMEGRLFRTISVSEFHSVQILQQQKTHTRIFLSITPARVYPAVRTIKMFSAPRYQILAKSAPQKARNRD